MVDTPNTIEALVQKHKAKASSEQQKAAEKEEATPMVDTQVIQFQEEQTFTKLGVCPEICQAIEKMGYKHPSKIQADSLPYTLKGRDIIGLAETGSGKTAAFAIPVI